MRIRDRRDSRPRRLSSDYDASIEHSTNTPTRKTRSGVRSVRRRTWTRIAYSAAAWAVLFIAWHLVSQYRPTEFVLLPSPLSVLEQMWYRIVGSEALGIQTGDVFMHFWDTFRKTLYGFAMAMVFGIPVGILMGRYRYGKNFFFDTIYIMANVPELVYSIFAVLIFGLGDAGPAVVVALFTLPVIAVNVAAGVEGVDPHLLSMSQAYDTSRSKTIRHVILPSFASFLFAAIRASFAASWQLATLAETFGGTTGVGVQVRGAFQRFRVTDMLAWMAFFVIFIVVAERVILTRIERYVFRYRLQHEND